MLLKKIILLMVLTFLILTSGCRMASHLLNPDSYSNDQSEPWEKKTKKTNKLANEL